MVPVLNSFSAWKVSWTLEIVDWQFLKSFVHTVSFLMCQSSFNPTLETWNKKCCCVGNPQCEKGKVHQTPLPASVMPLPVNVRRATQDFKSKRFQIQSCCFFYHATLQKYQIGSKPINGFPAVGTRKRGEQIDCHHHHLCHQTNSSWDAAFTPAATLTVQNFSWSGGSQLFHDAKTDQCIDTDWS